jgi:hypothetical protein
LTTTDETKPDAPDATLTVNVAVYPLPYFFATQCNGALYMWIFQAVMQHGETPLNAKTLEFVEQSYQKALSKLSGRPEAELKVIK